MLTDDENVQQFTREGNQIITSNPSIGPVFTENETYRIRCNKIIIQNVGNTKVFLFRSWTLMPGGQLVIGLSYDFGKTIADMPIEFTNTSLDPLEPTPIKRVEILEMHTNHPDIAFHSGFGKTA